MWLFKRKSKYEYGICNDREARRNKKTGVVEFILWKAGEQGHTEDYWHPFGAGWEKHFIPEKQGIKTNQP